MRSVEGRGGGGDEVDAEELPRPEIKFRQYFSSRVKCDHVLSDLVFPTPDMMRKGL